MIKVWYTQKYKFITFGTTGLLATWNWKKITPRQKVLRFGREFRPEKFLKRWPETYLKDQPHLKFYAKKVQSGEKGELVPTVDDRRHCKKNYSPFVLSCGEDKRKLWPWQRCRGTLHNRRNGEPTSLLNSAVSSEKINK